MILAASSEGKAGDATISLYVLCGSQVMRQIVEVMEVFKA